MTIEDTSYEIEHLQKEIEELKKNPTPKNAVRHKVAVDQVTILLKQQMEAFGKVGSFLDLYQSKQGELNKLVESLVHAKGFIERRRKMNEIVAIVRNGLIVAENAIKERGIEYSKISRLIEGHRTMLQEAEKLRESFGLLSIAGIRIKALFPTIFRLLTHRRISRPPGTRWLQFTEFFFSPKTVEGIFRPNAAEWQHEHFEALKNGQYVKVRWIAVRYHYSFVKTVGLCNLLSFIKWVMSIFKG